MCCVSESCRLAGVGLCVVQLAAQLLLGLLQLPQLGLQVRDGGLVPVLSFKLRKYPGTAEIYWDIGLGQKEFLYKMC